jgi:hypothetical protein
MNWRLLLVSRRRLHTNAALTPVRGSFPDIEQNACRAKAAHILRHLVRVCNECDAL